MDEYGLDKLFAPPEIVSNSTTLIRDDFRKVVDLEAVRIEAKKCSIFLRNFRRLLLNQPRLKNIITDEEEKTKRLLLLRPGVVLSESEERYLSEHSATKTVHSLVITYDFWTTDQVLRAILPKEITEIPNAFETIGHIAHVNLRDNQLKYKSIIGQVLLDKNSPQIRTVVNKMNSIDATFRFFKMEVLAGDNDMKATVKEEGCVFEFDFSKVYWNSRLQTEHKRLVGLFSKGDVVCDMFAGVGPFAVPAAKKGCFVHANDLNPNSYNALLNNSKLNKVERQITAYNMDGREFIKHFVDKLIKTPRTESIRFDHIVMNLPASAVQFLDVFKGLFSKNQSLKETGIKFLPMIHCYGFSKAEDHEKDILQQAEDVLGVKLDKEYSVYYVRDVAPKKAMMCLSFRLPEALAFSSVTQESMYTDEILEPPEKQAKIA